MTRICSPTSWISSSVVSMFSIFISYWQGKDKAGWVGERKQGGVSKMDSCYTVLSG
jgi:hypothetical protein